MKKANSTYEIGTNICKSCLSDRYLEEHLQLNKTQTQFKNDKGFSVMGCV